MAHTTCIAMVLLSFCFFAFELCVVTSAVAIKGSQCADDDANMHISLLQESIHLAAKRTTSSEKSNDIQRSRGHSTRRIMQTTMSSRQGTEDSKYVAIFVSGSLVRYQPDYSAQHLVAPLLQAGYQVDYYMNLNRKSFHGYFPDSEQFVMDSRFKGLEGHELEQAIARPLINAGATVRKLSFSDAGGDDVNASEQERAFADGSSHLGKMMYNDLHSAEQSHAARQNFLWRQKQLERLWANAMEIEQQRGKQYSLVIDLGSMMQLGQETLTCRQCLAPEVYLRLG